MPYANTWSEEKEKFGLRNNVKTMKALKNMTPRGDTHARMYNTLKERVNYKTFSNAMKKIAPANVQTVKAQLLKKFGNRSVVNAMSKYMNKNFKIVNQATRNKENAFIRKANTVLNDIGNLERIRVYRARELVNKYKPTMKYLDMYWEGMTARERILALKMVKGYYARRKKYLLNQRQR